MTGSIRMSRSGARQFLVLLAVYLAVAVPFRSLEFIDGLTDIRPVTMLMPVFGVFFGPAGAWAFAVGNTISDVIAGSFGWASVGGFVANFAAVYVYYLFWNRIVKVRISISDWRELGLFVSSVVAATAVTVAILLPAVAFTGVPVNLVYFGEIVAINNCVFALVPGIAIVIIMESEYGLRPYREHRGIHRGPAKSVRWRRGEPNA